MAAAKTMFAAHQSGAAGKAVVATRRPGGRSERVRSAVAEAVLELFSEHRFAFGVAEVAERAGVHRGTVYRRWPTRADLVSEALTAFYGDLEIPDTGSWEADIHALAATLARFLSDPIEQGITLCLVVESDPMAVAVINERWNPNMAAMTEVVKRAADRGSIHPGVQPGRLIDLLISPFLVQTVLLRRVPSRRQVKEIADLVIRAARP